VELFFADTVAGKVVCDVSATNERGSQLFDPKKCSAQIHGAESDYTTTMDVSSPGYEPTRATILVTCRCGRGRGVYPSGWIVLKPLPDGGTGGG
jgi:hypothetical protein